MIRILTTGLMAVSLAAINGCMHPDAGHHDLKDYLFGRRHSDLIHSGRHEPLLACAHELTVLEDDLRRDGTITVKKPDVWGDANLVHFIQEYDQEMARTVGEFEATLQAYLARSDQADFQASQSLAVGLAGQSPPENVAATKVDITNPTPFSLISSALGQAPPANINGLSIEPTESERQHSTYVLVNQSLRRRNMGDDNSRAAGYGLYKFRIPVSILPGRETDRNHAAVITLRAQLEVDEAHLRYTFPRLVVSDIVDELTQPILAKWGQPTNPVPLLIESADREMRRLEILSQDHPDTDAARALAPDLAASFNDTQRTAILKILNEQGGATTVLKPVEEYRARLPSIASDTEDWMRQVDLSMARLHAVLAGIEVIQKESGTATAEPRIAAEQPAIPPSANAFGEGSIFALRSAAQEHFKNRFNQEQAPKVQELRNFLFQYLTQVYRIVETRGHLSSHAPTILTATDDFEKGLNVAGSRTDWLVKTSVANNLDEFIHPVSWIIALQAGTLDRNLKRILKEMEQKGKIGPEQVALKEQVVFFDPSSSLPETLQLWSAIIQQEFPLTVFTLDPQIEEQNVFDAFSRRREMQVALAYGVATGQLNANRAMAFSRQIALEMETIGLNRTVVGFSHAHDTFGWYFYPRVQTPPSESTNIGALARTIWSTGPTEHYDQKHRNLEPGMRECEVIVAMPSFVTRVSFDVTTNWEKLTCPGKTKRSYEEMIAQGWRLQQVRCCLLELGDEGCSRPGDYGRLVSRVDQIEHMLGLQTHLVNVPYQYEQSGTDLFDRGNVQLMPTIQDFYGLSYGKAGSEVTASFFIRGKNFHPTLTHVVVGGKESHSIATNTAPATVEVISRELILIQTGNLNADVSPKQFFEVRVGTPAGLSNPLMIPTKQEVQPPPTPSSPFDWSQPMGFEAAIEYRASPMPGEERIRFQFQHDVNDLMRFRSNSPLLPTGNIKNVRMLLLLTAKNLKDETLVENAASAELDLPRPEIALGVIEAEIQRILRADGNVTPGRVPSAITVKTFIKFDEWPFEAFGTPINIGVSFQTK